MHYKLGQKIIDKVRGKNFGDKKEHSLNYNGSVSNDGKYPQFCMNASIDDEIFKVFKQNPDYRLILEHVSVELGEKYIQRIKELDKQLLSDKILSNFRKNDDFGGAILEDCTEIKAISPTTLRYTSVLAEIKNIFKTLDGKKVCEIGIGYGGQCRILSEYFNIKKYTLVDMYPVLRLAQKFLDNFALNTSVEYKTMNELDFDTEYDFVISNYAFAELTREYQTTYLNKIIKKSKAGYMIMNPVGEYTYKNYSKEELLKIIPNNPKILPEIPNAGEGNYVIVWGI